MWIPRVRRRNRIAQARCCVTLPVLVSNQMGVAAGTEVVLAGMWWGSTWEVKKVQCHFYGYWGRDIRVCRAVVQSCSIVHQRDARRL